MINFFPQTAKNRLKCLLSMNFRFKMKEICGVLNHASDKVRYSK
ncbi:hypothetical protein BAMTA208_12230 [Bacillus amyloliquefaciens TA208]|nr:hypothetical protein BAMTA208_12230 [Bacillus amyloliquefaciens TA208]